MSVIPADGLAQRPSPASLRGTGASSFTLYEGAIAALRNNPPADSVVLDIDEMGPEAAKSYPGQEAVNIQARPAQRAKQEIDYGRRAKGYVFGALWETTGDC